MLMVTPLQCLTTTFSKPTRPQLPLTLALPHILRGRRKVGRVVPQRTLGLVVLGGWNELLDRFLWASACSLRALSLLGNDLTSTCVRHGVVS